MTSQATGPKDTPYWWEAAPVVPLPETPLPKRADVVIIGAGYAGLSAAIELARQGRSVVALDRMNPGEGASSRNGGITSGNIRVGFDALVKRHGEARALAIEAEGKDARDYLYDVISTERIDCDLQLTGRFNGAIGQEQYDTAARNAEKLAKKLGIDAFAVPHAEQHSYIGTDHYRGGSVRMDIGGLHPAKLHAGLLRVAQEAGVEIHSGTHVSSVSRDVRGFRVVTGRGEVSAGKLLVCTNGYTDGADPWLRRRLVPVRSRIIATERLAPEVMDRLMPRRSMFGEFKKVGNYYRPSPDGTRILIGGRDSVQMGNSDAGNQRLRGDLARLFPELADVGLSHSWWGYVAMNRDMLPRIFAHDGILYATGFCGSGVVWANWLGYRAARKLIGEDRAPGSAFDFRPPAAIPFYAGKPWFMPAFISMYRLQDRRAFRRATR
ncbi:NAD(P)/FAD-dependent oxidoreductase [Paracoccus sediminicola]|uniref:NAD(P)/FAD-dependent oxidoreductase n=1 Tax=Paracoccus sediminicola TaxID=3017783 RepID=UPI0022F01B93|nr:FAD-binding oxidoreductase [Paracoccus sediminicola]WBU57764.1 FAD-binding oxidoreductase [Paracoccus sediminicola]